MPRSKYFSSRPLDFYIGADWQFEKEWSVYLSVSPAVNFQKETSKNDKDTEFIVVGTVGMRYHF